MAKKQKAKQDAKEPKEEVIEEILEEVPEAEVVVEEVVEKPAPPTPAEILLAPVPEGEYEIIELRGTQWKKTTNSDGTIVMSKLL